MSVQSWERNATPDVTMLDDDSNSLGTVRPTPAYNPSENLFAGSQGAKEDSNLFRRDCGKLRIFGEVGTVFGGLFVVTNVRIQNLTFLICLNPLEQEGGFHLSKYATTVESALLFRAIATSRKDFDFKLPRIFKLPQILRGSSKPSNFH